MTQIGNRFVPFNHNEFALQIIHRWQNSVTRPVFAKGALIEPRTEKREDGFYPVYDGSCPVCAQGDVLRVSGMTEEDIHHFDQSKADKRVAELLNISIQHSILLRQVNDSGIGNPENVLFDPEQILGRAAWTVLDLWQFAERATDEQIRSVVAAYLEENNTPDDERTFSLFTLAKGQRHIHKAASIALQDLLNHNGAWRTGVYGSDCRIYYHFQSIVRGGIVEAMLWAHREVLQLGEYLKPLTDHIVWRHDSRFLSWNTFVSRRRSKAEE